MKSNIKFCLLAFGIILALSFHPVPKQEQQTPHQKVYLWKVSAEQANYIMQLISTQPLKDVGGLYSQLVVQMQQQDTPPQEIKKDSTKPKKQ